MHIYNPETSKELGGGRGGRIVIARRSNRSQKNPAARRYSYIIGWESFVGPELISKYLMTKSMQR